MVSLESGFSDNASSVIPQPLIREWTDQLRNLDQKYRDGIETMKAMTIAFSREKNQLEAKANQLEDKVNQLESKVKAASEENEKLKTELATGSAVAVVNNMELLLKGLETRLNEKALTQNTALQKSNIILESINKKLKDNEKKMQQHTKTVQDRIAASAEVIEAQGKDAMNYLKALECMQTLSDSRTVSLAHDEVSKLINHSKR
jgi:outer membrane murein-binding lipoprotein Lpp